MNEEIGSEDWLLLEAWRLGDQAAASEFYCRNIDRLLRLIQRNIAARFATRFDADDVVQSVMRSVFRKAQSGDFESVHADDLWRMLSVIALNKVRNRVKKESRQRNDAAKTISNGALLSALAAPREEDAIDVVDLLESVASQVEPHIAKTLWLLLDGRTEDEIAAEIGVTTRSIRRYRAELTARISRAVDGVA